MKVKEDIVCKVLNSLYGLKQSPCAWNHKIDVYFLFNFFVKNFVDHNVYFKRAHKNSYVIITLHVDDPILASSDLILLKDNLSKKFEMVDLSEIQFFLVLQINYVRQHQVIYLSQNKYIGSISKQFGMVETKSIRTLFMTNCKFSKDMGLQNYVNLEAMWTIPFQNAIENLMHKRVNACYGVNNKLS
jgi:hypothetical protein